MEVSIIGLDIAKHVFHAHGADGRGRAVFSKRISRGKLLDFFAAQPSCTVALEAVCELPYGPPQLHRCIIRGRTDGSIRLVPMFFKSHLHLAGRPQMSTRPSVM